MKKQINNLKFFKRNISIYISSFSKYLITLVVPIIIAGFTAVASAQDKPVLTEVEMGLAQDLFNLGRFGDVMTVLVSREIPSEYQESSLFLIGLSSVGIAIRVSDKKVKDDLLVQAVDAFRAILVNNPGLVRVRLELARTFFLQEKDRLARQEFERVLASNPPAPVQANINNFLEKIKSRRRLRTSLSVDVIHNSNINNAPSDRTIFFLGLPFKLNSAPPKSGFGIAINSKAEYRHPLSDRTKLLTGVRIFRRELPGSVSDQTVYEFFGGPEFRLDRRTELSLSGVFSVDNNKSAHNKKRGLQLQVGRIIGTRTYISTQAGIFKRRYSETNRNRNSTELEFGTEIRYLVSSQFSLNGSLFFSDIERKRQPERGTKKIYLTARMSYLFGNGYTAGLSLSFERTKFKGLFLPQTKDGNVRADKQKTVKATLLKRDFTVLGFSPQLEIALQTLNSNAQATDSNNTTAQVTFVRQF